MNFSYRKELYKQIEQDRGSKVLSFVTGTRQGLEIEITHDCIGRFVELLDEIGPTRRISLILHTFGGDTLSAWQLVNLIRMYCNYLEVNCSIHSNKCGHPNCNRGERDHNDKTGNLGAD